MIIGNVSVGVGVDCVIRRVRSQLHARVELFVVLRLGARIGLSECLYRFLHELDAHPFSVLLADYRSMMTVVHSETL